MFNWKVFLKVFGAFTMYIFIVVLIFVVLAIISAIANPLIKTILSTIGFITIIAIIVAYKHP